MELKELFQQALKYQELLKSSISVELTKRLQLQQIKDNIEIKSIDCIEEFQSDCDGDDNHVICEIELKLNTQNSIDLFAKMLDKEEDKFFGVNLCHKNHILYGDNWRFYLKYYI